MTDRFTIAIDGPAASGKGTISRALAAEFGFVHLDTGLLYRAVGAVQAQTGGDPVAIAAALSEADLARDDLRSGPAAQAASKVAALPEVREALIAFQRDFALRPGGAVLDGRDIGTVICPDADVKFFVTASDAERARRRHAELSAKGDPRSLAEIEADIAARDRRDREREAAPLRPADDAHLLDTTNMAIDAAVAEAARWINEQLSKARA
ncbi:MAG: (d)CMP kinase [Pseudomonadota bacterium]